MIGVNEPSLFDQPAEAYARRSDPDTAHAAAAAVDASALERLVVTALGQVVNATTKELATSLGRPRDSLSPRMPALVRKGLVRATPIRRDGCIVWERTP